MALDRTWFYALIDDDGSGLTGSVWDTSDIKNLLDSVDAEIARLDATTGLWTPTLTASGGGTPAYNASLCKAIWARHGRQLTVQGRVAITSRGSLGGLLSIGSLPVKASIQSYSALAVGYYAGLTASPVLYGLTLRVGPGVVNAAELFADVGTGASAAMGHTNITDTFDCVFGGSYVVD